MSAFDHYAHYYDLLYREKRYDIEAEFIHQELLRDGRPLGRVLELGSGTGRHAIELARRGWVVDGVDLSANMIDHARERSRQEASALADKIEFRVGDVRQVRTGRMYGAVVSLFHVMSYHTSYADLTAAIRTAANHLSSGGLFFFDFWYGPAVLSDPPAVRVRQLESERVEVTRIAQPTSFSQENRIDLRYRILIRDKETDAHSEIVEDHQLRYWFLPELEFFLKHNGFKLRTSGACYTREPLSPQTWYGWLLAERMAVSL